MKNKIQMGVLALMAMVFVTMSGCRKHEDNNWVPFLGHWGCEQYISCRTDSTTGREQWDTLQFEACTGGEYELFFYNTGKGLLKLNNSPAFIKEFTCNYKYDSLNHVLEVEGAAWLYAIYGSLTSMENHAEFLIESLTDSTLVASWTNMVSEPQPFFERFFLRRIEDE
jgi:hypothetical protein